MTKWKNLGDINFLAYGGCLVKPHFTKEELSDCEDEGDNLKYIYDVFYLNPEYGEADNLMNFAALCCVDLQDTWIDYHGLMTAIGEDWRSDSSLEDLLKDISPELLAKEIVEYEGAINCNPTVVKNGFINNYPYYLEDFIVSDEDLISWLKELGAEEYV